MVHKIEIRHHGNARPGHGLAWIWLQFDESSPCVEIVLVSLLISPPLRLDPFIEPTVGNVMSATTATRQPEFPLPSSSRPVINYIQIRQSVLEHVQIVASAAEDVDS